MWWHSVYALHRQIKIKLNVYISNCILRLGWSLLCLFSMSRHAMYGSSPMLCKSMRISPLKLVGADLNPGKWKWKRPQCRHWLWEQIILLVSLFCTNSTSSLLLYCLQKSANGFSELERMKFSGQENNLNPEQSLNGIMGISFAFAYTTVHQD